MIEAGGNIDAFLIEFIFTIDWPAWWVKCEIGDKVAIQRKCGK